MIASVHFTVIMLKIVVESVGCRSSVAFSKPVFVPQCFLPLLSSIILSSTALFMQLPSNMATLNGDLTLNKYLKMQYVLSIFLVIP